MGDGRMDSFFLKLPLLSLMTSYRMSLISTGSISLNSTFNSKATYTIFSVLYISVVVILHEFALLHEGLQSFWHVRVAITSLVFPGCSAGKGSYLPHVTLGCCSVRDDTTVLPRCGRIRQYDDGAAMVRENPPFWSLSSCFQEWRNSHDDLWSAFFDIHFTYVTQILCYFHHWVLSV